MVVRNLVVSESVDIEGIFSNSVGVRTDLRFGNCGRFLTALVYISIVNSICFAVLSLLGMGGFSYFPFAGIIPSTSS